VTGGSNLSLYEVNQAAAIIKETASPDVNLIFGAVVDENMGDNIRITVIATGFDRATSPQEAEPAFFRQETPRPQQDRLSTYDSQAKTVPNTQPAQAKKQEEYVYSSEVDITLPAFVRRELSKRSNQ